MKRIKIKVVDHLQSKQREIVQILQKKYEVEISDAPEFLFYGPYGSGREHYGYPDAVKICLCSEGILPDFNECDYGIGSFPMKIAGGRYLQVPYVAPSDKLRYKEDVDSSLLKRKFCNFIYSNPNRGEGAILRKKFCQELMKYKNVDCPGWVLNNMKNVITERSARGWREAKIEFMRDYKFTISFENVKQAGMTSEKLSDPFLAQSIPIYWGDPEAEKIYRPEAYIDCTCLKTIQEMVERVIEIDTNEELYMKMLSENAIQPDYDWNWESSRDEFIYDIIEKGTKLERDPLGYDRGIQSALLINELQNLPWFRLHQARKKLQDRVARKLASKK